MWNVETLIPKVRILSLINHDRINNLLLIFVNHPPTVVLDLQAGRLLDDKEPLPITPFPSIWSNNNNIHFNNAVSTPSRISASIFTLEINELATFTVLNDSSTSNDSYRPPFTTSQSQLLSAAELMNSNKVGHVNPNFTSSTSLDRPPSARSSYSNYHGVRTLAYNNKQAAAQVPSNSIRRNSRPAYSTFFNDGPPAYEIQGVVNSETVIWMCLHFVAEKSLSVAKVLV